MLLSKIYFDLIRLPLFIYFDEFFVFLISLSIFEVQFRLSWHEFMRKYLLSENRKDGMLQPYRES